MGTRRNVRFGGRARLGVWGKEESWESQRATRVGNVAVAAAGILWRKINATYGVIAKVESLMRTIRAVGVTLLRPIAVRPPIVSVVLRPPLNPKRLARRGRQKNPGVDPGAGVGDGPEVTCLTPRAVQSPRDDRYITTILCPSVEGTVLEVLAADTAWVIEGRAFRRIGVKLGGSA